MKLYIFVVFVILNVTFSSMIYAQDIGTQNLLLNPKDSYENWSTNPSEPEPEVCNHDDLMFLYFVEEDIFEMQEELSVQDFIDGLFSMIDSVNDYVNNVLSSPEFCKDPAGRIIDISRRMHAAVDRYWSLVQFLRNESKYKFVFFERMCRFRGRNIVCD